MSRSFIETAFETLEDRQLLSVSIPTRHVVAMHHSTRLTVSLHHSSSTPLNGVRPIVSPGKSPFAPSGGGDSGGGGGGVINHPGGGSFHN